MSKLGLVAKVSIYGYSAVITTVVVGFAVSARKEGK